MANWFECKVRYDKTMENGAVKKVTEPYMISIRSLYKLNKVDLCKNTNIEIFSSVIFIKRTYRNMELVVCTVVLLLLIWMSLSPSFINTWRMYYIWGLIPIGYVLEFLWYKSNQKLLDKIANWENN